MKEAAFVSKNTNKWKKMEMKSGLTPDEIASQFVELTDDLAYASTFYPGTDTESYLHGITRNKFLHLYKNGKLSSNRFRDFWFREIPELIAMHHKEIIISLVLFLIAGFIGAFSAANDVTFVRLILGDDYVNQTLKNIENGDPMAIYRTMGATESFLSITINNIKVSFVAFVLGVFFSVGTIMIILNNGIMLGAFQYFFYQKGLLLTSVLSIWIHGTIEITSIIIAGGAGIVMGNSLLLPGSYPRAYSFRKGAVDGVKIAVSLVPFFIIAGFFEGFVTRHTFMPAWLSIAIIAISLILVVTYFIILPYKTIKKTKTQQNGTN